MTSTAPELTPEYTEAARDAVAMAYACAEWLSGDKQEETAPQLNRAARDRIAVIFEASDAAAVMEDVRRSIAALTGEDKQVAALIVSGFPDSLVQTYGSERVGEALDGLRDAYTVLPKPDTVVAPFRHPVEPGEIAAATTSTMHVSAEGPSDEELAKEIEDDVVFDDSPGEEELTQEELEYLKTTDTVRWYRREAARRPLLSAEQEVALAKQVEVGLFAGERLVLLEQTDEPVDPHLLRDLRTLMRQGETAKSRFLESNLRLVVSIAMRYQGRGMEFLDLIQEGNLGLVRALEKFDYEKGYKFSTYATWWIRQSITRGIGDRGKNVRIPLHMQDRIRAVRRVRSELEAETGRQPSVAEVAGQLGLTEKQIADADEAAAMIPVSLDIPVGEDGDMVLGDLIEDATTADPSVEGTAFELNEVVDKVIATLPGRESEVLRWRFGMTDGTPRTLEQVGEIYGLTRERIRQIESKALARLRHPSRRQHFKGLIATLQG